MFVFILNLLFYGASAYTTIDSTTLALVDINDPILTDYNCYSGTELLAGTTSLFSGTANPYGSCPTTGPEADDCMATWGTGGSWGYRLNRGCDVANTFAQGYIKYRTTFGSTTVLNIYPETVCKTPVIYRSIYNARGARYSLTSSNNNYIRGCIENCTANPSCTHVTWDVSKCSPLLSGDTFNYNYTCTMYSSCTPEKQTATDSLCGPSVSAQFGYSIQTTNIDHGPYYSTSTVYQVRTGTPAPTNQPTAQPTAPTSAPTTPTSAPTNQPTAQPTAPTSAPTVPTSAVS